MQSKLIQMLSAAVIAVAGLVSLNAPAFAQGAPAATPAPQPEGVAARVRGTINGLNGNVLNVTTREGETIDINLGADFSVNAAIPMTLADVADNAYVGVVADTDAAGNLVALDVRIFPEANRGRGAGSRPWDLTPTSSMNNGTVAEVDTQPTSRLIRVTYPDGERLVLVTPDTPIWTTEAGDASLLVAGAYVVINARKLDNGSYTATSVMVEKDGTRPTL